MPVKDEIPAFPMRRNAIQRAFSNIISNAIRYSSKTVVHIQKRNDEVIITFDDNGSGIPEERRADAIRPFIRLEESRNRRTGGTGLGLSITSDIVLSHGGELTLGESSPWRTSRFDKATNLIKSNECLAVKIAYHHLEPACQAQQEPPRHHHLATQGSAPQT